MKPSESAATRKRERCRQRADECGREECKAQLHRGERGCQPLHNERAEIGDRPGVLFIGNASAAKRLDDLDGSWITA